MHIHVKGGFTNTGLSSSLNQLQHYQGHGLNPEGGTGVKASCPGTTSLLHFPATIPHARGGSNVLGVLEEHSHSSVSPWVLLCLSTQLPGSTYGTKKLALVLDPLLQINWLSAE